LPAAQPAPTRAQTEPDSAGVYQFNIDGVINSGAARRVASNLDAANGGGYELALIQLNTPGGDLDSTRAMVGDILSSEIPVAVYVAPEGARAASAGTFIGAAADFLAMADATNIGAASPVDASGGDLPSTLDAKVREDAAALIRSIADARNRNAAALESTVNDATSYTAREAVELDIADLTANNVAELLNKLNGMTYRRDGVARTLNIQNPAVTPVTTGFIGAILDFLSNPNLAFIFIVIGLIGIAIEVANFGLILPGVAGIAFLSIGVIGAWQLPLSWIGVSLLAVAAILFIAEIFTASFGLLAALGGAALIIGGVFLFDNSDSLGVIQTVSPWAIGVVGSLAAALILWLSYELRRSQKGGGGYLSNTRSGALRGKIGVVTSKLAPQGEVHLNGEYWVAISDSGNEIPIKSHVKVVRVKGLHLWVEPTKTKMGAPRNKNGEREQDGFN